MAVQFENPPIVELTIAVYFDPAITDLQSEHIGLFWHEIRDAFPAVDQEHPMRAPAGSSDFDPHTTNSNELFPMPMYHFVGKDDASLIHIQKDAFMFGWHSQDQKYIGYNNGIKPAFDKYYDLFSSFVHSELNIETPNIKVCELSYLNIIEKSEVWTTLKDTKQIIPSFSMLDFGMQDSEQQFFNCRYYYSVAPDLQINININNAVSTQQADMTALLFGIKVRGQPAYGTKSSADDWFKRAHDVATKCFMGLTNQECHTKLWGLRET